MPFAMSAPAGTLREKIRNVGPRGTPWGKNVAFAMEPRSGGEALCGMTLGENISVRCF